MDLLKLVFMSVVSAFYFLGGLLFTEVHPASTASIHGCSLYVDLSDNSSSSGYYSEEEVFGQDSQRICLWKNGEKYAIVQMDSQPLKNLEVLYNKTFTTYPEEDTDSNNICPYRGVCKNKIHPSARVNYGVVRISNGTLLRKSVHEKEEDLLCFLSPGKTRDKLGEVYKSICPLYRANNISAFIRHIPPLSVVFDENMYILNPEINAILSTISINRIPDVLFEYSNAIMNEIEFRETLFELVKKACTKEKSQHSVCTGILSYTVPQLITEHVRGILNGYKRTRNTIEKALEKKSQEEDNQNSPAFKKVLQTELVLSHAERVALVKYMDEVKSMFSLFKGHISRECMIISYFPPYDIDKIYTQEFFSEKNPATDLMELFIPLFINEKEELTGENSSLLIKELAPSADDLANPLPAIKTLSLERKKAVESILTHSLHGNIKNFIFMYASPLNNCCKNQVYFFSVNLLNHLKQSIGSLEDRLHNYILITNKICTTAENKICKV